VILFYRQKSLHSPAQSEKENKNYMKIKLFFILMVFMQSVIFTSCNNGSSFENPKFLFTDKYIPAPEDDPDGLISLYVYLSAESDKPVSVDYVTADSTAVAGKDYVAITSGNLTFQPGELAKQISFNILPDTAVKTDVYFTIKFTNPVNGSLTKPGLTVRIINVDFVNLAWTEEFTTFALNTTIWNYEQGAGGWGNNELQTYTSSSDNVYLDSGYLHITALNPAGTNYTSGRINTFGKKEFTYGRIDIRAKLPEGKGIWPALWMLGTSFPAVSWPACGEIDMMELLGHEPSVAHGAVHWNSNGHQSRTSSFTLSNGKFSSGFHIFSFTWTPNKLIWRVDKQQYFFLTRAEIPDFPFDLPQFLICNVAVGGNWPGSPDGNTVFPQNMIVDYIRIYQ
jgi:hypothetical protein